MNIQQENQQLRKQIAEYQDPKADLIIKKWDEVNNLLERIGGVFKRTEHLCLGYTFRPAHKCSG